MSVPNTTQIPNIILDSLIQQMTDTELRIVLIIARKTMGWFMDEVTGMRKRDDSLSHVQLMQLSGRSNRSLSRAIHRCNSMGWLEIRNKRGLILRTSKERSGQILFYRLGPAILSIPQSYPPVDNYIQPLPNVHRLNNGKSTPLPNWQGLKSNTYIDARNVDVVRSDSDYNNASDFKNSRHDTERPNNISEKDIHQCYYLADKMHEPDHIKLYLQIAKQIGVDLLERAIGLAREDSKINNKGAYMVKICKGWGYKPHKRTEQI